MKLGKIRMNDKTRTVLCQTNMSPKRYIKRYKHQKWTLTNCLVETSWKPKSQSVLIFLKFVHPRLLLYLLSAIYTFFLLTDYFYFSLNCRLRAVSLFFLVLRAKRKTRKWPHVCAALFSRVSRLRRSTLARVCTPLFKSEENERLLAV